MKLIELEPRWLTPTMFVFRCPHCRTAWLSCKSVAMRVSAQYDLFRAANLVGGMVPCKFETAWSITGDFEAMNVVPSLDASASGHWHGFIQNGSIA